MRADRAAPAYRYASIATPYGKMLLYVAGMASGSYAATLANREIGVVGLVLMTDDNLVWTGATRLAGVPWSVRLEVREDGLRGTLTAPAPPDCKPWPPSFAGATSAVARPIAAPEPEPIDPEEQNDDD
jgi:hypothetical protein